MIGAAAGRALGGCGGKIRGWMCGWEAGREWGERGVVDAVVAAAGRAVITRNQTSSV